MKKLSIFILLLLMMLSLSISHAQGAEEAGVIIQLIPPAWVERGEERILLSMKAKVMPGDVIYTGEKAKLQMLFTDDSILAMGPKSSVTVDDYVFNADKQVGEMAVSIGVGIMRMVSGKIVEANPDAFSIKSPLTNIGIRGTMTGHVVQPSGENHVTLHITSGHQVSVQSSAGGAPQIMTGSMQQVNVQQGSPAGDVQAADPGIVDAIGSATTVTAEEQEAANAEAGGGEGGGSGDSGDGGDGGDSGGAGDSGGGSDSGDSSDSGGAGGADSGGIGESGGNSGESGDTDGFAGASVVASESTGQQAQTASQDLQTENAQGYASETTSLVQDTVNTERTEPAEDVWFTDLWGSEFLFIPHGEGYSNSDQYAGEPLNQTLVFNFYQKNGKSGSLDLTFKYPYGSIDRIEHEANDGTVYSWSTASGDSPIVIKYVADTSYTYNGQKYLELGWWNAEGSMDRTATKSTGGTGTLSLGPMAMVLAQQTTQAQFTASAFPRTSGGTYEGKALGVFSYAAHNSGALQTVEGLYHAYVNFNTNTVQGAYVSFENLNMSGLNSVQFTQQTPVAFTYDAVWDNYYAEVGFGWNTEGSIWYDLSGTDYMGEGWLDFRPSGADGQGIAGAGEFSSTVASGHDIYGTLVTAGERTLSRIWGGESATMVGAAGGNVAPGYLGGEVIFGLKQVNVSPTDGIAVIRNGAEDISLPRVSRISNTGTNWIYEAGYDGPTATQMTYTQVGTHNDSTGAKYMQWGVWNVVGVDPMATAAGGMEMAPILDVEGYRTSDLSTVFSNLASAGTTSATYSGTARALYQVTGDTTNQNIATGTFSANVDFQSSTMTGASIVIPPNATAGTYGMTLVQVGGAAAISGSDNNHFEPNMWLNSVTNPAGVSQAISSSTSTVSGHMYGSQAEGMGGAFAAGANLGSTNFEAAGVFEGTR